jgi:xanthine dehydrogenase iron-sulfur cluster and FAD-binding subunit A
VTRQRRVMTTVGMVSALALPSFGEDMADPAVLAAAQAGIICQCNGYEVVLRHTGSVTLPKDTVIGWNVPFARMSGTHTLTRAFAPGEMVMLSAVLGSSYVSPAKPCITALASASE